MSDAARSEILTVGMGALARPIAVQRREGGTPGLFWLGGFRSDMTGTKAEHLDRLGAARGLAVTRFDYSGHGASGGDFFDGTISRWLEETRAVFDTTAGEQIVIGSSMGGWLALLLARSLRRDGIGRLAGNVLIAPAVDMTEALMWARFPSEWQALLMAQGRLGRPAAHGELPYAVTRELIEDGRKHLLLGAPIEPGCPVAILQGSRDTEVPQAHAELLLTHLLSDSATLTVIPDGDHRLSRPQDLAKLDAAIERLLEPLPAPFVRVVKPSA